VSGPFDDAKRADLIEATGAFVPLLRDHIDTEIDQFSFALGAGFFLLSVKYGTDRATDMMIENAPEVRKLAAEIAQRES
jgi:hypothetical protein